MACCCSRVKSTIRQLFINNRNEQSIDLGLVQRSPISTAKVHKARNDGHEDDSLSRSFADISAPNAASERLCNIGSWPAWKRQLDSGRIGSSARSISWVLERVPDPTPFQSIRKLEGLLAALESSYKNCIFEGPYRSEHEGSVLCTSLDRIARFGCCSLCKSIAGTVRSGFPLLEPCSRFEEVVIWCAEWGDLEANEFNKGVVAKAIQSGTVFLTIGEQATEFIKCWDKLTKTSQGGDEASFAKFWEATTLHLLSDHQHWPFAQEKLRTCQWEHESCRISRVGASTYIPRRLIAIGSRPTDLRLIETDECDEKPADLSNYAALSYCWGTSGKNYKTTAQNLPENKTLLPLESLPNVSSHDGCQRSQMLKQRSVLDNHQRYRCVQSFGNSILVGRCNLHYPGQRKRLGRAEWQNAGSLLELSPCSSCRGHCGLCYRVHTTGFAAAQRHDTIFWQRRQNHTNLVKRLGK